MEKRKVFLLAAALIALASVFFPWVVIESRNIVISGLHTDGTAYGKPGILNLLFTGLILLLSFLPRTWAQRICIFCAAVNVGWSVRNFLILSVCQGGECPQRQPAFYIYLLSSFALLIAVFIQKIRVREEEIPV